MDLDFKLFIKFIKEKTGIELSVYDTNGDFIIGSLDVAKKINPDIKGVVCDKDADLTLFTLNHKNKGFIGCIKGCQDTDKTYAVLISELAENHFLKDPDLTKEGFFKAILFGELNYSQLRKYVGKFSIPDIPSCVMLVTGDSGNVDEVISVIKAYSNGKADMVIKLDDSQCAFIKFIDEASNEYHSFTEYANFLVQSVLEETGHSVKGSIGGTVKSVYDLSSSFAQANTANRMSVGLGAKGEVHSFKEYVLIKMIEDLPKFKLNEYLEILMDANAKEIFEDEEMINTAEEFLENSLNVSETSRNLYLHRNTLMYRLDKIEKMTGLNVRKFSDAVTFRLITILSKLIK
ncbi:MAG: hypothetical protein E7369_00195 [Clostridiales bacterium]|nr:hypothetical protein [Clostridiales bacterium]